MSDGKETTKAATRFGEDYNTIFNGEEYQKAYYSSVEGNDGEPGFLPFVLHTMHSIFNPGNIKGGRLLDIGSGPCIHSVISASKWFDEITLTDFADSNRKILEKWLKKDDGAWNWEPFFKYAAKLEGNEDKWEEDQENFRKKTKSVLHCDVHKMNPLYPVQTDPFDAVATSLCLEASSLDAHAYKQSVKNVMSLLKPRGHFVLVSVLNESYYDVDGEIFFTLSLKKDTIGDALEEAGLENITWYEENSTSEGTVSDFAGVLIVTATKKDEV